MSDTVVLLEEKKEIVTFRLDEGTISETYVVTTKGSSEGYEYSNKCFAEDVVCISEKSEIKKERVKKYSAGDSEIPIGIIVNDPFASTGGERKANVLLFGRLYRLKLATGQTNIKTCDKLKVSSSGAIADTSGEFIALHPVADSDEYNYINCFQSVGVLKGEKGDTGAGLKILGYYDTLEELISAYPNPHQGDAFIVSGFLYVWNE